MRSATRRFHAINRRALLLFFFTSPFLLSAKTYIHKPSSIGNDYYIVFPKAAYGDVNVEALVSSAQAQQIIATKAGGLRKDTFNITSPRSVKVIDSIFHIESVSESLDYHGAAYLHSSYPVSVIGQYGTTGISGTYTALPVNDWGTEYVVLDEEEGTNSGYKGYYPSVFSVPQVTIIASQNNTTVDVTLPPNLRTARGKTGTFKVTLYNAGDVYYFTDGADPNAVDRIENQCSQLGDFTGTHIVSEDPSKPVGVIVSQSHTSEPCGDNECGDFGMEWLPPIANWDTSYVITPSVPHGGTISGQGEILRAVCAYPSTTMWTYDAGGRRDTIGVYQDGYPLYFGQPIIAPYVLSGDKPFLVAEITTKPQSCLVGNRGGGANFTFSMVFLPGVDQWSDYVPIATADLGSGTQVNLYFRQKDENNLFIDGVPLKQVTPVVPIAIPGGFAYLSFPIGPDSYHEIRGINGATAGGAIFGYGSGTFSANNGGSKHTLDPEMNKSFAHPAGINGTPLTGPDTTAPTMAISPSSGCGTWHITVYDTALTDSNTGIYSVYLSEGINPDSSFNVTFHTLPSFQNGASSVAFEIDVMNLADSAAAALHIRDGAGNELDTTLFYAGRIVTAAPNLLYLGSISEGDTARGKIVLTNRSDSTVAFAGFTLQSGKQWKIVPPSPAASDSLPLLIPPGKRDTIYLQFTSPVSPLYECIADTLLAKTCRTFPIAAMNACTIKPAIYTSDYDFGCYRIDTLSLPGDTEYSQANNRGVFIASVGSDTLHVTGATLAAVYPPPPYDPNADFKIMDYIHKNDTVSLPFALPPGDTIYTIVRGHAHQSGDINARILYTDDADHNLRDTSLLHICGLVPGILANTVDYGTFLYGTVKDSFVVVKNTGQPFFTLYSLTPLGPDSAYFTAYPFGDGYQDPTTGRYIQYPNDSITYAPGDTNQYPFRFVAKKLGPNVDSISVSSSLNINLKISLLANVTEPHIWGRSGCLPDTLTAGDTATVAVRLGNTGTDSLVVDTIAVGGADANDWTITRIYNSATGETVTAPPWKVTLIGRTPATPYGDVAYVSLLYRASHNGTPNDSIFFSGYDALGRHANDSIPSFYNWGAFPYDTTVAIVDCIASGVNNIAAMLPSYIVLSQNYPNPFSSATTFSFTAQENREYRVEIYNALGARIASLPASEVQPGKYAAAWNASGWASGVYYYRVSVGANDNFSGEAKSFLLLR